MRVIAGSAKGRILKFPKSTADRKVRPLSDQAKESLFNILVNRIEDCVFLDMFAGTGQVGIEALSRGAKTAYFVEADKKAAFIIKENLHLTSLSEKAEVIVMDAVRSVDFFQRKGIKFDLMFLGAPYTIDILPQVLDLMSKNDIINENGVVIAEHSKRQIIPEEFGPLCRFRQEKYGDTVFSFYRRNS